MFRKVLGAAAALLFSAVTLAQAAIVGPLPFTLTNGSVADASQVMANFNKIVNDVNNNVIFPSFTQQNYYAVDTGAANALVVTLSPVPIQYVPGMVINVKVAASNTGATTINANGLGNQNVVNLNGSPIQSQQLLSGAVASMVYDGTQFELTSLTPLAVRQAASSRSTTVFTAAGAWTFTIPAGVYSVRVEAWGGGGGGGGAVANGNASGAGGGAYGLIYLSVSPGSVISGNVGASGTVGASSGATGGTGGTTTLLLNGVSQGSLTGGAGGLGAASALTQTVGGVGGSGSGSWLISLTGQSGFAGLTGTSYGGPGGSAPRGGVGGASSSGGGGNPGGGAGGGANAAAGGLGGNGWVYIEY